MRATTATRLVLNQATRGHSKYSGVANGYQGGLNLISRALLADESCCPGGRSQAPERMAGPVPARMRGIADSAPHVIRYPVAYCRVQIVQFGVHRLPPQNAGQAWCNGEDWIQGGAG